MTLKQKVRLFVKIQAATFAIGVAFIIRENADHGTFLYFLRTDRRPRNMKQVFFKWSILFLILEFTTEWTKYGWGQATTDFPVLLVRYAAGGALAAAVWWLIERSPRTHPDAFYKPHGHGHHHGHASTPSAGPTKRGHDA